MSISFEALAMSGANYLEFGMDIEEWERLDSVLPPHLYAEDEDKEEEREEDEAPRKRENLVHDFKDKKLTNSSSPCEETSCPSNGDSDDNHGRNDDGVILFYILT
ncbi:hypothetical protein ACSBR2_009045 [Camellia fascicularis]